MGSFRVAVRFQLGRSGETERKREREGKEGRKIKKTVNKALFLYHLGFIRSMPMIVSDHG